MTGGRRAGRLEGRSEGWGERILVTGIGAVSACGWGVEALWKDLLAGRSRIGKPRRFDTTGQRTHFAAEVPEPEAGGSWLEDASRAERFAVAAAREAYSRAGLEAGSAATAARTGVFFGSSTAGMDRTEAYYRKVLGAAGPAALRLLLSNQLNTPGDAVARELQVTGPVQNFSSACSSGALAIGIALDALRRGEVDVAIAGGADALCGLTYAGFNSLRAVDEKPCRPFRRTRAGLSIGEGAAALVLERGEAASRRGASPLAELLGAGASCDAHHMTAPHPQGSGAALAMRRALDDGGLPAADVSFLNTHGTGTPQNDAAEWQAIETVFASRAREIPVNASKAAVGHLLGSAGAIEAVATVQTLRVGLVHAQPQGLGPKNLDEDREIDPGTPVRLAGAEPLPLTETPRRVGLSTSFAFGGANAALLFAAADERPAA